MTNDFPIKFKDGNRPAIRDIIPRSNRKDSLLANIMKPLPSTPLSKPKFAGGFLRSLPFGRGNKKFEKVIRLKKTVSPEPTPLLSGNFHEETKRAPVHGGASRPLPFAEEIRRQEKTYLRFLPSFSRLALLGGGALIAVVAAVFSFALNRATVSLEPSTAVLSLDGIRISVSADVRVLDSAKKIIPGFLVETSSSLKREFSPSAKERVLRKATGAVRIYNGYSSVSQALVARTRLQDSSGRIFFLKQRVTVPGAEIQNGKIAPRSVVVAVEAERAGAEFNIGPARFTLPGFAGTAKFSGFYAESQEAFTGGFEGEALIVRQADIDAASEAVTAALFSQLKEALERKIPAGATVLPGAREITVHALRKPNSGEARDSFSVEADGTASVMLFRMDDIFSLLDELVLAPGAGKKLSREKSHLEFDRISLLLQDKILLFDARGTVAAVSALDPAEFQRFVSGKTRADAENILRADSRVRAFDIKLFPVWKRTVPSDIRKIRMLMRE